MEIQETRGVISSIISRNMDILLCPACKAALNVSEDENTINCSNCNQSFRLEQGIPLLFWPDELGGKANVTEIIKSFYEDNPFPGYEGMDSDQNLRHKAEKGIFARLLDEQIPHGARILEVGCGTGQLSNFLGLTWGRTIFATDVCLNSLKIGNDFKQRNDIQNVAFIQMNLFRSVFKPDSFDVVICNGMLHHTAEPFTGFKALVEVAKKGGFIIIGLYNTWGRIPTDIRRVIFKLSGNYFKFLDPRLRNESLDDIRKHKWFIDQYNNPHESKHTFGEVLNWFDWSGIEFITSIPKSKPFVPFSPNEKLFEVNDKGTRSDHLMTQMGMLLAGGKEGGFFTIIGRKKG